MPKLSCKCGHVINLSPVPGPDEFWLISDADMEDIYDATESSPSTVEEKLQASSTSVVICPSCGRFYVSKGNDSLEYNVFSPEQ
jgi:hypothetical protein